MSCGTDHNALRWRAPPKAAVVMSCIRVFLMTLTILGVPGVVCGWQEPYSDYRSVEQSVRNEPPSSAEAFTRLPPPAPPGASAFMNPPLLVVQRSDRIWSPEYVAQRVAAEPQPIRLPPTTFIPAPDERATTGASGAPSGPFDALGGGDAASAEPVIGLATPPDGPKRHGFFAKVFGPGIEAGGEMLSDVRLDYLNFYSPRSLLWLGGGIGVAAILANTPIDQHFRNWYQDDVRSPTSDRIHDDIAWLGNGGLMLPIWLASGYLVTPLEEYSHAMHVVGTWGRNSTRAFLVGGPTLLALQYGLGAHRPSAELDSNWHPFKDSHGASGDAWIGAISFLTAAKMTDSKLAKVALWSLALFPAWGRIDVDQHYLSQVTLGVWLAALSVEAVDRTDRSTNMFILPTAGPGSFGATIGVRW
jgi:membrane-associated phospholipid phosphatase